MHQHSSDPGIANPCWLNVLREAEPDSPIIVCFPHAGGSVLSVAKLARSIPERFGLVAVALPGREPGDQDQPPRHAATAGRKLGGDVAALFNRRRSGERVVLLGNSYGALLAFETARSLQAMSDGAGPPLPIRLIVSGFRSPSLPPADAPIFGLPSQDLIAELCQRFGLPAGDMTITGLFDIEDALRADLEACDTYRCRQGSTLDARIDVLAMAQDASVSRAELQAWQEVTTASVVVTDLDCGHFPWSTHPEAVADTIVALIDDGAS